MLSAVTLDMAKKHLNIESSFTEDDNYILDLITVADEVMKADVNEDLDAKYSGATIPSPLIQAELLFIGHMYQNREIVNIHTQSLPYNYKFLIDLYRNYNR